MVLAGPGTGKTQLLSLRTANILRQTDLYPSNILILTYTNAGVKAMRERLARIIGPNGYDVVVETFHGFANSIIVESEEAATVKGERIEMTDLERIYLLEHLLDTLEGIKIIRPANAPYLYRADIQSNMSALKRDGITPERLKEFLKSYKADGKLIEEKHVQKLKAFCLVYEAYEKAKAPDGGFFDARGRYDFDDMILLATDSLRHEPDLLAKYQEQFQYVMVDEFQDTNGAQLELLKVLFNDPSSNVCVVGDDDQSIYRFQGASAGNFHLFENNFLNTEKVLLHKNYRSNQQILEKSAGIIQQIPPEERVMDKPLEAVRGAGDGVSIHSHRFGTLEEELTFLVQQMKQVPSAEWNDSAVLVRDRKSAQDIIEAFLQSGIPYSTDGKEDIRGEFRIQQLLKLLRLAQRNLEFEEKDLLLFEVLLFDFWQIDYEDLIGFTTWVAKKKNAYRKSARRKKSKVLGSLSESEQMNLLSQVPASEASQSSEGSETLFSQQPTLFNELLLRFPAPHRTAALEENGPTEEESQQLTINQEISLKHPNLLHTAAWALGRFLQRSAHYPVLSLVMDFVQDSDIVDFILNTYKNDQILKLRELRSVSSFVENLKKANQSRPGISLDTYVNDLDQLERHDIPLAGEMVSSNQDGIKILTAHGSKGLEFKHVFVPFCVQEKAWPKRPKASLIPLPHELMIGQESVQDKETEKKLHQFDENRLFYVATTRAKDRLFFTAAPQDKQVVSQFLSNVGLAPDQLTRMSEEQTLIQLLKKTPQSDPVKQSGNTLAGLVEEIALSPSSLNNYLTCPRKFLYHNLIRTPQKKIAALVYGQCIHKALEKSYRRFLKEGTFPPIEYFEEQFLQQLEWEGPDPSAKQSCLHKLEDAKKWYEQTLQQGPIKPLELERKLTKKMPDGLIFSGQFDKVELFGSSGEVQVVDYKTGEPDKHIKSLENCDDIFSEDCDDYLRQLIAYKMLYESGYNRRKVTSGQLVFIDPVKTTVKKYGLEEGTFVNKSIPLTQDMVKQYEKLIQEIWKKIQDLQFDQLPEYDDKKCDFCPYRGVCWRGICATMGGI
ncbi:MAG: ATP-dependent helicase [Candidatus Altimarinota bacterium]